MIALAWFAYVYCYKGRRRSRDAHFLLCIHPANNNVHPETNTPKAR
jgi:hypothetical protein